MTTDINTQTFDNDRFSWRRVGMVARYWWPSLKAEFWIFLGITFACSIVGALFDKHLDAIIGAYFISFTVWFAYWGPAIFGRKRGRELDVVLPARNSEKMVFKLIYALVVLPLITYVLENVIYDIIVGKQSCIRNINLVMSRDRLDSGSFGLDDSMFKMLTISSTIGITAVSMLTLYCATFIKRNAVLKSIVISLVSVVVTGLAFAIALGIYSFYQGLHSAYAGEDISVEALQAKIISSVMPIYAIVMTVIYSMTLAVFLALYIRKYPKLRIS